MTFSLLGRCATTGAFGMVVSSSSTAVAARCAYARAGVGAVASQNITDPRLGPQGLDLLAAGLSAPEALDRLVAAAPHAEYRQLAVLDREGRSAVHSGARTLGVHAAERGGGCVAAGNLLADAGVPAAMVAAFEGSVGEPLGNRLLAALRAGLSAGGEAGPVHSAGLLMVKSAPWPVADLRVDWAHDPIGDLEDLWGRWAPEMDAYVTRALDPATAPAYGVPGDP
ncbi:hypothetical protein GCM10017083_07950 [Thalassobaculum fulvum]|uniref:DUF1028 domain-containing protein n=1 Tax=Thalassobaculum fulvum TaxID=1633335 RepID=A0A918XQ59_9PROT|nr:DUF1028 domain-containing protein [Thalassobaculum fulvum]GHD42673.1 hypothetical protein GCM10017083_07950 [Thalassobaculum fulvum]